MEMQFLMQQAWWFPGLGEQPSCCGPGSHPGPGCGGWQVAGVALPHWPWPGAEGSPTVLLTWAFTSARAFVPGVSA